MRITCQFDSGAIEVIDASQPENLRLRLPADNAAPFRQWFHFRVSGVANTPLRMVFENARDAAYPDWQDYRCLASYDRRHWFRIAATSLEPEGLVVSHVPERDSVFYAYFEPYSYERHLELVGRMELSPYVQSSSLGLSVEGREIDLLTVGRPTPGRRPVWLIARQHPGETMGEWLIEGLLERLIDAADPVARRVRELGVLYIVPNLNPDGGVRGNLRTNAAGCNLNRAWRQPDARTSPEVFAVRNAMQRSGCSLFLDIHGDEELPYVFAVSPHEVPGYSESQANREVAFLQALSVASPDFQTQYGYAGGRFGDEMLDLASNWVAHTFGCLSLTLEMPFKDNAQMPDGRTGWSAARSKRLGAALLEPIFSDLNA